MLDDAWKATRNTVVSWMMIKGENQSGRCDDVRDGTREGSATNSSDNVRVQKGNRGRHNVAVPRKAHYNLAMAC